SRLAGTGNPFALGSLQPGETVVELGCGAAMDTLIASRMVGPNGRVISIDMTPEMLDEARAAASTIGATNIDFHLGYIENIPLPEASADVIISNGVINLAPDKKRDFREMHRVLKADGHLRDRLLLLSAKPILRCTRLVTDYAARVAAGGCREDAGSAVTFETQRNPLGPAA